MALTRKAEERIEKSHLAVMRHPSFCCWAGLLFIGTWKIENDIKKCPTAYVNMAGDVVYSRAHIDNCTSQKGVDAEVNFTVLHETGHKALLHLTRGKKHFQECPMIANIAADHVVNNMILESDPQEQFSYMPRDKLGNIKYYRAPKYKGWSFQEVYKDLMQQAQTGKFGPGEGPGGGCVMVDVHELSGAEPGEPGDDATGQVLSDAQIKDIEAKVEDALRSGSYLASKMGGSGDRLVGDMLSPKIDWREQMRDFVQDVCQGDDEGTWRRPNRRFVGMDIYLPSYITESIGKIVVAIDASGSVGGREIDACVSESMEMCRLVRPSELVIIWWSDGITRIENYTPDQYDQLNVLTKPKGGGGTVIEPVADWVRKHADGIQAAIILTDGCIYGGSWGEWGSTPTLWAITSKNITAPCGKSLYLEVE